jgi:DMSO reductase anchor subunit
MSDGMALERIQQGETLHKIRFWLIVFMTGLFISGITAFPLQSELSLTLSILEAAPVRPAAQTVSLLPWIARVHHALSETNAHYPFLAYGTDWLAFAHLVLAVLFIGPYLDPVRNKWVVTFGLIACAAVIPLALIAGHIRGIPLPWRLIDCSFGIFGGIPLLRCRRLISALEYGIHAVPSH